MDVRKIVGEAVVRAMVIVFAAGCAPSPAPASPSPPSATSVPRTTPPNARPTTSSPISSPEADPSGPPSPPADPLEGMPLADRVAQLFMVGTGLDEPDPITLSAVRRLHIGGIFLRGRSDAGREHTAELVDRFAALISRGGPRLWVATDQEGGKVQALSGPGFDTIPSALEQTRSGCAGLRDSARGWGHQLAAAGVTMDLAPVVDVVTSPESATRNPPIGRLQREYGFDAVTVARCAGAVAAGLQDAHILPTLHGRLSADRPHGAGCLLGPGDHRPPAARSRIHGHRHDGRHLRHS